MKQPPKMLTPKDCLYLEDLMNVTVALFKKCNLYMNLTEDRQIKTILQSLSKKMSNEANIILSIIGE